MTLFIILDNNVYHNEAALTYYLQECTTSNNIKRIIWDLEWRDDEEVYFINVQILYECTSFKTKLVKKTKLR